MAACGNRSKVAAFYRRRSKKLSRRLVAIGVKPGEKIVKFLPIKVVHPVIIEFIEVGSLLPWPRSET
jgi:Fe2+ transport system protein FeoA